MSKVYTSLKNLQSVSSQETGSYPSDLLSGWYEEDLMGSDETIDNDSLACLVMEFAHRFNKMTKKQKDAFIFDSSEVHSGYKSKDYE